MCKYNKGIIKQDYKVCCGGKKVLVDIYYCEKKGYVEYKDCRKCRDFKKIGQS